MKWRKRQKKTTHTHTEVDFFLLSTSFCWSWWLQWCATLVSSLEDWRVTDSWPLPDHRLPASCPPVVCFRSNLSTTDSPLGGAALRHWERASSDNLHKKSPLQSAVSLLTDLLNPLRLCAWSYTQLCSIMCYFLQLLNNTHKHKHT